MRSNAPLIPSTTVLASSCVAAGTGDQTTGGVKVNYVPRDGGNNFRLSLFATGANSSFQGDNMTPELVARGLRQPNSLKQTYDVNPTGGGPIVRDKLWLYSATRFQTNQNYVAGIYDNKNAGNVNSWVYDPDLSSQGLFKIVQKSANTRITWQANPTIATSTRDGRSPTTTRRRPAPCRSRS